jgi:S1-C subfamily serine protease
LWALTRIKNATGTNYDVVTGFDSIQVRKKADLLNYMETKSVGDQVALKLLNNGKTSHNMKIALAPRPSQYDKIL